MSEITTEKILNPAEVAEIERLCGHWWGFLGRECRALIATVRAKDAVLDFILNECDHEADPRIADAIRKLKS